jgi:hypothetical protein
LEMALIRLTEIGRLHGLQEILERLVALEARLPGGPMTPEPTAQLALFGQPAAASMPSVPSAAPLRPAETRPPQPTVRASAPPDAAAGWTATVERLRGRKRLASVLAAVQSAALEEDRLTLEVANGNAFVRDTLEDPEARQLIAETAAQTFGRRVRLEYRFAAVEAPRLEPVESPPLPGSQNMRDHPLVREALNLFGGTLVREART